MNRIVATGGGLVGSYAGWVLGALEGTMTAFILSIIGTALGIIAARRIVDRLTA